MDRNIKECEDEIVVDSMFVVCRNIFSQDKIPRKDIQKPCLLDFFYLENAIFVNLVLKAILRAIRGENRLQNRIK
jgi:hypothetical protein